MALTLRYHSPSPVPVEVEGIVPSVVREESLKRTQQAEAADVDREEDLRIRLSEGRVLVVTVRDRWDRDRHDMPRRRGRRCW